MAKRLLGLDIGSFSIKAVEVQQTSHGIEIGTCQELLRSSIPAPDTSDANDDEPDPQEAAFSRALREFLASHNLSTDFVVSALPGNALSSRHLHFPFNDARKLAQAIPFELEEGIPFELEQILADWDRINPGDDEAEVLCTFTPRKTVAATLERLTASAIRPRILEAEGLVLTNLYALFPLPGSRILLDLGHTKTTLCWMEQGAPLAMRTIPVGGKAITEAIAQERGGTFDDAEDFKHEQGIFQRSSLQSSYPGALAILERIAREILLFRAGLEDVSASAPKEIDGLDLMGGGAHLHQIEKFLHERTGLLAQRLATAELPSSGGLVAAPRPLALAPALALAIRGTTQATTHANFLKEEFAPQIDLRRLARHYAPTLRLAVAAIALALVWSITHIGLDLYRANQLGKALAQRIERVFPNGSIPPGDPLEAMEQAVNRAQKRADFLGVYRGNLSALDLLEELSRGIPADVDASIETMQINRNAITLSGLSNSFEAVDRIREGLESNEYFQRVDVSDIQNDPRGGGKRFHLSILLSEEPE